MKIDMTKGNPLRLIIFFALPLFASNLFQQFYNLADTAIVGHILGDEALSAVGSVSSIYGLIMALCFGMTNGFAILISQYFGAGDQKKMKQAIAGTVMLAVAFTLVLTVVATLLLKPVMRILNTPDEIFDNAYTYIRIVVVCCVVMVFYNMLASILRALGNSKIPLVFLVISSVLNIGLDLLFIKVFGLGIAGAAYATVLAQLVSGVSCLIYIVKCCPELRLERDDFRLKWNQIAELLASGFAMSLMWAVVNIGTLILQSGINGLGSEIIAAHVAARKISEIYMMGCSTLSSTMATYAGQNYGAGEYERVWKGVKTTHILGFIWATAAIIITFLWANQIVGGLTGSDNETIIATGAMYLKINLPWYYVLFILCILRNTLQGIGCKIWPIVGSLLELLGKWISVTFFVGPFGYLAICYTEPATWVVCALLVSVVFATHKDMRPVLFKR